MVFQILRLALLGFVVLTVVYVLVSVYSRSVRREKLEKRWEDDGRPGDRDAYVETGLRAYDASFRRKLIVAVYIVPIVAVGALIYIINIR